MSGRRPAVPAWNVSRGIRPAPDMTSDLDVDEMVEWLIALDGVRQDPRYHPEGDALFHSLQVFEHALRIDVAAGRASPLR